MPVRIVNIPAILAVLLSVGTAQADGPRNFARLRTPDGVEFAVVSEKPRTPAPTLFVLAIDAEHTLTSPDYNKIGALLARDGVLCVSLDAPCHGNDNKEKQENALAGWRERIERGDDLIRSFTSRCTQVLDYLIAEHWTDPARVAASGTSRGGFLALHFATAEPRVRAVAAFAPVTKLLALAEFDGIKDRAAMATGALSLNHFADKLAGRPVWVCIGNNDLRVGTNNAIEFTHKVLAESVAARKTALIEIHVTTSEGHTVHPTAHAEAAAFIRAAIVSRAAPSIAQVGNRTCLFLDDRFVAEQSGLIRTWHRGRPLPEPAIVGDAWDQWPHLFGSVVFDPQEKLYRMWYSSIREGMYYAESRDGRVWRKPKLGLCDFNGSKDNNLVMSGVSLPNVILDPSDNDPAGRFKLFAWDHAYYNKEPKDDRANGHTLFRSQDGVHWKPAGKGVPGSLMAPDDRCANFITPDTNQVIWDTIANRYLLTFRTYPKRWALGEFEEGRRRSIGITTAQRVTGPWQPIVTCLVADREDDRAAARHMRDVAAEWSKWAELYSMPTFTCGNHYIGLLSVIHVARNPDGKTTAANIPGGGDLQLAFSHDGTTWHRPPGRQTLIAASSAADLHPVYAACSPPLEMGEESWIYYAEANASHPSNEPRSQIRAATWRKDGFASLATTGDTPGILTTPALAITGGKLQLNVDVERGGEVRVELLKPDGKPINGFAASDCDPVDAGNDGVSRVVSWRGKSDLWGIPFKTFCLRISLKNGRIYAFRFAG